MNHELKTDPKVFDAVMIGAKTFEIRKDDRDFSVGHTLELKRTEFSGEEMKNGKPLIYTGYKPVKVLVTHLLRGPVYGLEKDWVIMSFKLING